MKKSVQGAKERKEIFAEGRFQGQGREDKVEKGIAWVHGDVNEWENGGRGRENVRGLGYNFSLRYYTSTEPSIQVRLPIHNCQRF